MEQSTLSAQRGSLGRTVALVANERLARVLYHPDEGLYHVTPFTENEYPKERFIFSGTTPFRVQAIDSNGSFVPGLVTESDLAFGRWCYQQKADESAPWTDINDNVASDFLVNILCRWTGWDIPLTSIFEAQLRCSTQYLADAYAENRPCPTRDSSFITWEQSIVEANINPLHKCRMPVDPKTQPTSGFNFKQAEIAFMAVQRDLIDSYGPLEQELAPLLKAAGVDPRTAALPNEVVLPVHEFQVRFLLSRPEADGKLRLLPQRIKALAQASTRSMTIPSLPGLGIKLSLSMFIGDNIRTINHRSAYNAVRYWTAGMLDPARVCGLQGIPLEILPEVTCANALGDHLACMVRWDPYHSSRPPVDADVGYAVTGALIEPAEIGKKGCVAESAFELTSLADRLNFLRDYTRVYFRCFLTPLFRNGLLLDAHGQNSLVRFSRSTGQILGFSSRDMSGTRFNGAHFTSTTGIEIDPRMSNHDMPVPDLLERAYFIFFVVHLCPLLIALDLDSLSAASFTSAELLTGIASPKESADLAKGNGCAVIVRELHEIIREHETLAGEEPSTVSARELAAAAREIWLEKSTWQLQCFVSQRMRADWACRDKNDKRSFASVPNVLVAMSG
ncbi:hypothetical protein BO99DRAFT_405267 [Aspergillus violaceofuscus CBS 115571]|uniref:Uncharacterized protein n=1 Tax=Aspergillus violaceofuscus (strain CBS 115571) TaxID=1450538 RepID=A0A2V5H3V3_ASPV1|nr:hypothetical protein BO99DRAFT_405267 [Aspergillus violaceofuscus CBS 115571]